MSAAAVESRTWRRTAVATVVVADVVVLLAGGAAIAGFVPFAAGALALFTLLALRRPGGHAALGLLLVQVLAATVPSGAPGDLRGWALAAAVGTAVLATHLALALLAAWPVRAALPRETLRRWLAQGAALTLLGVAAAGAGAALSLTPSAWGPWVAAGALALVAAMAWTVREATRRG
ncbi:hypothetical protein ACK8HX_15265 [Oryzobacter sp. R7]|uniref:hypothetical protein n=1 Tax=Oryzobacter faecalis TaxID=3388656 RepID=UPI00398CFB75